MYYLFLNDAQHGPYALEQVRAMLAAGEITPETLMWTEGQADWQPLESVLKNTPAPLAALPPEVAPVMVPVSTPTATSNQVVRVGIFSFLGGMGVTLAVIGAIVLVLLLVVGGFIGYTAYIGNGLDKSSKEYVDDAIPAIVTAWSPDQLLKRESKAFQKATPDEQMVKLFEVFRKLGALKSYQGNKGEANISYTPENGKVVTATYVGSATFEKGDAQIRMVLTQENGAWKILGFRVDSPVFLK